MNKINNGNATTMWQGISHGYLLSRCNQATPNQASAMSAAASLMIAGECSESDWADARAALAEVEFRLCAEWEAENGAPLKNRFGMLLGGHHPALRPDLYEQALNNQKRV